MSTEKIPPSGISSTEYSAASMDPAAEAMERLNANMAAIEAQRYRPSRRRSSNRAYGDQADKKRGPQRRPTAKHTWEQAAEIKVEGPIEDAYRWWHALRRHRPLQDDLDCERSKLNDLGVLPLSQGAEVVARTGGMLSLESSYYLRETVGKLRKAAEELMRMYPNLLMLSPGVVHDQLAKALAVALCTTWADGGKELEREVSRAVVQSRLKTRAELWRVRWQPYTSPIRVSHPAYMFLLTVPSRT